MSTYDVADELLVTVVFDAAEPIVRAAREVSEEPLPRLRSETFLTAPRAVQQAVLIIGGMSLVLGDPVRVLLREVSNDVHGGDVERWRGLARRTPREVILARRAVPGPTA